MTKKIDFDGSWQNYLMRNGKFSCGFNMPDAIEGKGEHGLPPYAKRMNYLVDEYPACPDSWMKSEGRVKSFFVPVEEGQGMWLDLNENANLDRHVAVVVSIQGINPITGLPCKDAQLEQYIDTCPKHKKKFGADRYCKECGFKWPKQNYLATTGTPSGEFWLDGFKSADGLVRQYILTAEKLRGVASNIIGKDRVYAIGLSFFLAKERKPQPPTTSEVRLDSWCNFVHNHDLVMGDWDRDAYKYDSTGTPYDLTTHVYCSNVNNTSGSFSLDNTVSSEGVIKAKSQLARTKNDPNLKITTHHAFGSCRSISTKKLEVAAGAKVRQNVYDDPESLDFWHSEPESIICVNYCIEADARKIIEAGREEIESHPEGFLQDISVGN